MKKLLIVCLFLVGCPTPEEQKATQVVRDVSILTEYFGYYKDTTTGLCFAGIAPGMSFGTLTNVPCTEQVEKVAHKFFSRP